MILATLNLPAMAESWSLRLLKHVNDPLQDPSDSVQYTLALFKGETFCDSILIGRHLSFYDHPDFPWETILLDLMVSYVAKACGTLPKKERQDAITQMINWISLGCEAVMSGQRTAARHVFPFGPAVLNQLFRALKDRYPGLAFHLKTRPNQTGEGPKFFYELVYYRESDDRLGVSAPLEVLKVVTGAVEASPSRPRLLDTLGQERRVHLCDLFVAPDILRFRRLNHERNQYSKDHRRVITQLLLGYSPTWIMGDAASTYPDFLLGD